MRVASIVSKLIGDSEYGEGTDVSWSTWGGGGIMVWGTLSFAKRKETAILEETCYWSGVPV